MASSNDDGLLIKHATLGYRTARGPVRTVTIETDGDTTHVYVPRSHWGAIVAATFAFAILIAFAGMLWLGNHRGLGRMLLPEKISNAIGVCIVGGGAAFMLLRLVFAARYGHRPIALSVSPRSVVFDDPCENGGSPCRWQMSDIKTIAVTSELTALLSRQIQLRIQPMRGLSTDFVFSTRDRTVASQLQAILREKIALSGTPALLLERPARLNST
jgi:hypothetical protein